MVVSVDLHDPAEGSEGQVPPVKRMSEQDRVAGWCDHLPAEGPLERGAVAALDSRGNSRNLISGMARQNRALGAPHEVALLVACHSHNDVGREDDLVPGCHGIQEGDAPL